MLEYMNRPGGLHRMDVWRLGQLGSVLGDVTVADALSGWSSFKAARCTGLAPATVDRFRATLQAAINHAAREGGWHAPAIPHIRFQNQRIRYLTKPQQEALLAAYAPHVQPIALMLCFQGCRTQEALQLQWDDVNLERGTVWYGRTKTGVPRTCSLHDRVRNALAAIDGRSGHVFRSIRKDERGDRLPYADTRDYKLPGGNPLRRAHATACRKIGLTGFTIHDLRHNWAARRAHHQSRRDRRFLSRYGNSHNAAIDQNRPGTLRGAARAWGTSGHGKESTAAHWYVKRRVYRPGYLAAAAAAVEGLVSSAIHSHHVGKTPNMMRERKSEG